MSNSKLEVAIGDVTFSDANAIFSALDDIAKKSLPILDEMITTTISKWIDLTTSNILNQIKTDNRTYENLSIVLRQELLKMLVANEASRFYEVAKRYK